jgi:hypothetical protein
VSIPFIVTRREFASADSGKSSESCRFLAIGIRADRHCRSIIHQLLPVNGSRRIEIGSVAAIALSLSADPTTDRRSEGLRCMFPAREQIAPRTKD